MEKQLGPHKQVTTSPKSTGPIEDMGRTRLARRALIRGGALGLVGAISTGFSTEVLADTSGAFSGQDMPYQPGMVEGVGVDVVKGIIANVAVDLGALTYDSTGHSVDFNFASVDRLEDAYSQLDADVNVSGYYAFFSTEATFDFTNKMKLSRQQSHIIGKISVLNPYEIYRKPSWGSEAVKLLQSPNFSAANFRDQFGDGFVRGIQRGGEYYALYSIFHDILETQQAAHAALSADFNTISAGGHIDGELSEETKRLLNTCSTNILTFQRGGKGNGVGVTLDPAEIVQRFKDFTDEVQSAPVILSVKVSGYNILGRPDPTGVEIRQGVLKHLMSVRLALQEMRADVEEQQVHPEAFVTKPSVGVLNEWDSNLTDQLDTVNGLAYDAAAGSTAVAKDYRLQIPTKPILYQPPKRPDVVTVFENKDFVGLATYYRGTGFYDQFCPEMGWLGRPGGLASIKVPAGISVRLYQSAHFQGDHIDVTVSEPSVVPWSQIVRCLAVYDSKGPEPVVERVVVCERDNFGSDVEMGTGRECRLDKSANVDETMKGHFDLLAIRSILVPNGEGMKATVFSENGFQGSSVVIHNDVSSLQGQFGFFGRSMILSRDP